MQMREPNVQQLRKQANFLRQATVAREVMRDVAIRVRSLDGQIVDGPKVGTRVRLDVEYCMGETFIRVTELEDSNE